jgi:hypothetical protein
MRLSDGLGWVLVIVVAVLLILLRTGHVHLP